MQSSDQDDELRKRDGVRSRELQPEEDIPYRRLAPRDGLTTDERRQRDRDRLLATQLEGFSGPTWRLVQADTWGYLLDVLPSMIRSGKLAARRRLLIRRYRTRGGTTSQRSDLQLLTPDDMTRDEARDLAADIALDAMTAFHKYLSDGRWDLTQDITFRSFAVNTAAWKYGRHLQRWLRARAWQDTPKLMAPPPPPDEFDRPESIIHVVDFDQHVQQVANVTHRAMLRFDVDGLTDDEIAEVTQSSLKQVEYGLKTARARLRQLRTLEARRDSARGSGTGAA